jgi:hypothetical protein
MVLLSLQRLARREIMADAAGSRSIDREEGGHKEEPGWRIVEHAISTRGGGGGDDVTTYGRGRGDSPDVGLRRAVRMLIRFVGEDEKFAITNQSLASILRGLQQQLHEVEPHQDETLLDYWDGVLEKTHKRMLNLAESYTVSLPSGSKVPLVTESIALNIMSYCPHPPQI